MFKRLTINIETGEYKASSELSSKLLRTEHACMTPEEISTFLTKWQTDIVVHSYNPSTQEVEAGGFQIQGQRGYKIIN
jgi:hypothetical protein